MSLCLGRAGGIKITQLVAICTQLAANFMLSRVQIGVLQYSSIINYGMIWHRLWQMAMECRLVAGARCGGGLGSGRGGIYDLDKYAEYNLYFMADKMDNQALQKYYTSLSNRSYPPPFPSLYPPSISNPPYPNDHYLPATDKSKTQSPYSDYFKNAPYYPNYPPSQPNKPTYPSQPSPPPFPGAPHQKTAKPQQTPAQNGGSGMYPMGMPSNSPYPYGYPYYSYPNMPYPYGMYPSYYYNRSMSDMYAGQSTAGPASYGMAPSMMPPPYYPPVQPHYKASNSPIVKQEIVISSDEDRDMPAEEQQFTKKQTQKQLEYKTHPNKPEQEEKKEKKQLRQPVVGSKHHKETVDDNQTPFEIKRRKRIVKQEKQKNKQKKQAESKKPKEENKVPPKVDTLVNSKEEGMVRKQQIANLEKERVSGPLDSKQNLSSQRVEPKKVGKAQESILQPSAVGSEKQDKKAQQLLEEKQNQKKERLKDDHPLRELRYTQSHGRIRIGHYYQCSIPSLLCDDKMLLARKLLQERLKQREISAITF